MAKANYGPLVSGISGSIGGITFKATSGGAVIQARQNKVRSYTPAQLAHRIILASLHNAWRDTSSVVRLRWANHASIVGTTMGIKTGSKALGFRAFSQYHLERHTSPINIGFSVPAPYRLTPVDSVVTNMVAGDYVKLVVYNTNYNASNRLIIQADRTLKTYPAPARQWKTICIVSELVSPTYDITSSFDSALGEPILGEYIHFRVRIFRHTATNDPWASSWVYGVGVVG